MYQIEKYSTGSYLFPSDDIPPMEKRNGKTSEEFCLAFCKAFYSGWGQGSWATSFSDRDKLVNLRKYSRGNQPIDIYYDLCYGRNKDNEIVRKGWMNVNWDVLQIALQFKDAFISKLNQFEYDPWITAQDQFSRNEKQTKFLTMYVENKMKDILKKAGGDEKNISPDSLGEFETLQEMGEFKNKAELAWEKFINVTFNGFNKWDLKLNSKLKDDIYTLSRLCVRDYVDTDTQTVKCGYVDPANWIGRLTPDGDVIDGGFLDIMTVQDLRKESGLSEEILFGIARTYCGYYGNKDHWTYGSEYGNGVARSSMGNCEWYAFRVPVLKCEYRSLDTDNFTEQSVGDEKKYFRDKYDRNYKNSATKKTIKKSIINYYRGSWIVGTDYIYDCGLQYDMPRPEKAEARCSFHYFQMDDPSIVERCRVVFDQVQLNWLKFQNAVAKSKPDGYLFDLNLLKSANVGEKIPTYDSIKGIMETGNGFFSMTTKRGAPLMQQNVNPVIPVKGGYLDALNTFILSWNAMSQLLYSLSGMNPSFVGSPTGLPEGKGINEGQANASMDLLTPKINAYKFVRESVAQNILLRGQVIFRHNEEMSQEYKNILGEDVVEVLRIASEKNYASYGLSMGLRLNGTLKVEIKQAAEAALQAGRNGQPGLTFMEYFKVLNMMEGNMPLKSIETFMARAIGIREKQMQQEKMQMVDQQNQGLAAIEQQKEASALKIMKESTDLKIQEIIVTEAAKHHFAVEKAGVDAENKLANDTLTSITDKVMEQYLLSLTPANGPAAPVQ